jgi:hypothetical protein
MTKKVLEICHVFIDVSFDIDEEGEIDLYSVEVDGTDVYDLFEKYGVNKTIYKMINELTDLSL